MHYIILVQTGYGGDSIFLLNLVYCNFSVNLSVCYVSVPILTLISLREEGVFVDYGGRSFQRRLGVFLQMQTYNSQSH